MKINSTDLRLRLEAYWPPIYVLTTDRIFTVPDVDKFKDTALKAKSDILNRLSTSYISRIYECEDIAKILIGKIIENRVNHCLKMNIPSDLLYSWSFGICFGTEFNGWVDNHWALIAYASDTIYLLDSQTMDMWKAGPTTDKILFALI